MKKDIKEIDWAGLIKTIRDKNFLDQSGLAKKIKVTKQMISLYENDKIKPTLTTVKRIKKAFPELPWEKIFNEDVNFGKNNQVVEVIIRRLFKLSIDELEIIRTNVDYLLKKKKDQL